MKFLILSLATLAVASASLFGGKSINVLDDGTIVVRTDTGKQIMISKTLGSTGQNVMEIDISGPFTAGKKIQIDDNNLVRVSPGTGSLGLNNADLMDRLKRSPKITTPAPTQADILADIMKEFQGIINQAGYEKFLTKLQKSVTKGKIDQSIVDYVQNLAEDMPWHITPTTAAPAINTEVQYVNPDTLMPGNQLPWYLCNDLTCFKQMMILNGIYQKSPMMTYDQYMRVNALNNLRMNPMTFNGQMSPNNIMSNMEPIRSARAISQDLPMREGQIDTDLIDNEMAARKNFWNAYMNKIIMNSYGTLMDKQQQLPVNTEIVNNKLFY